MPLNVISNFAANVAHRNLTMSDAAATSSLAKLSAGTRVLSAKDDAASMAVGSRLNVEVSSLKQAAVNAGQAISMLQVADGAMSKINDILTRMKTLSVQSGSDQLSATERAMLDTEYQSLLSEVDRIATDTDFAGTSLINGGFVVATTANASDFEQADGVHSITFRGEFQSEGGTGSSVSLAYNTAGTFTLTDTGARTFTGTISSDVSDGTSLSQGTVVTLTNANTDEKVDIVLSTAFSVNSAHATGSISLTGTNANAFTFKVGTGVSSTSDDITIRVNGVGSSALSINATDIQDTSAADTASLALSNAIDDIQSYRANIGASQNRLEFAAANIATQTENTEAARSQLLDLDVAAEMSNFTSKQILVQAGVSMLAQANQLPQNLLRLFQ